jgi:hypothetical protein
MQEVVASVMIVWVGGLISEEAVDLLDFVPLPPIMLINELLLQLDE